MPVYGYRPSGAAQAVAHGNDGSRNYWGYVPDAMTEDGWGYAMGVAVGPRVADTLTVYLNMHDSGSNPSGIRQQADDFTVTEIVVNAGDTSDAKYTSDFPGEVTMNNGSRYPLSAALYGQIHALGMIEAASYPGRDNYLFYMRDDASAPPPDPMGYTSTEFNGHLAIWVLYETNVAPDKPDVLSPADGSTPSSTTPTFSGNFDDSNETLPNGIAADELDSFQLEVRRVSDNALMWSYDEESTSSERSARAFSRTYDGTTLAAGTAYKWRCRVRDRFGTPSVYSDWATFTPGSSTVNDDAGTPTGKQETQAPTPFTAVWTHTGGLSTNAVRVRIRNRTTGSVVRQLGATGTGTITKTVTNGGTISITWAEIIAADPTWANLPWGSDVYYQIQGRDTGGNWSGWSDGRNFTVNAAPAIPSNLAPNYTTPPQTSLPLITATVTDADDDSSTGLLVKAGIVGPYAVTNPALASATTGWTFGTTTNITRTGSHDAAVGHDATGSIKCQITANTAGIGAKLKITNDDEHPCVVGQSYTAKGWLRTDNANITPRMIIEWYTVADALISTSEEADWTPTINVFSERTVTATAPATADHFKIGFEMYCDTANPLGSNWGDDFSINNATRYVRDMAYDATALRWEYQTVADDIPSFDTYSFWAYSYDGTVYSGGTTTETSASKSSSATFVYTTGPDVAITAPTEDEVLDTDTPTITWTVTTTQAARRVVIRDAVTLDELVDTGMVATVSQEYEVLPGILEDDTSYEVLVQVTDTLAAVGSSPWWGFSLDYAEPATVPGWSGSPTYAEGDVDPSAVLLTWNQVDVPSGEFLHYRINREPSEDIPFTLEELDQESRRARIGIIPNVATTQFVDYTPPSGTPLRYRIRQYVQKGSSWVSSQVVTVQVQVDFQQSILQTFPEGGHGTEPTHRVVMEYREELRIPRERDLVLFPRMGKRKKLAFKGVGFDKKISGRFRLHGVDVGDVKAMLRELDFMDGGDEPLLWRDADGRYMFCVLERYEEVHPSGGRIRDVDLTLAQIDVPEVYE